MSLPSDVAEVLLGSIAARHLPNEATAESVRELFVYYLRDHVVPGADMAVTCAQHQLALNRLLAGAIAMLDAELSYRAEREGRSLQEVLNEILLQRVGP